MSRSITLTNVERLILANQYEILSQQADNEYDTVKFLRTAKQLRDGHKWLYEQIFEYIDDDLDNESAEFVVNVLSLHRALLSSYEELDDKSDLKEKDVIFKGFDGNNEGSLMYFAEALSEDGRFCEVIEKGNLNSHCPMIRTYQEMLQTWEKFDKNTSYQKSKFWKLLKNSHSEVA